MENRDLSKEISDFITISKYSKFLPDLKRREQFSEAVDRNLSMHLKKFDFLPDADKEKIIWAFELVNQKKVGPSMRSMQFGGPGIESKNERMYNCAVRHIDSLRAFAESFFLLLCGTGVSFGLSKFFLERLPLLASPQDKSGTVMAYVVQDTIEGWSDSTEALLMSYFKNTPFTGRKIVFDYSRIRSKGAPLKTSGGRAPGHEGLKQSHEKIKILLDRIIEDEKCERIRPIHAYDILMHCADAVLSGGIRRAATAVIFDKNDKEMMEAKTTMKVTSTGGWDRNEQGYWEGWVKVKGKKEKIPVSFNKWGNQDSNDWEYTNLQENKTIGWSHIEPQRARSNNSILLLRSEVKKKELEEIIQHSKQWGEPGFVFADHPWTLLNPCLIGDSKIKTSVGEISVKEAVERLQKDENLHVLSFNHETNSTEYQPILFGEQKPVEEIYELELDDGTILKFSKGHKVYTTNRGYVEIENLVPTDEVVVTL